MPQHTLNLPADREFYEKFHKIKKSLIAVESD